LSGADAFSNLGDPSGSRLFNNANAPALPSSWCRLDDDLDVLAGVGGPYSSWPKQGRLVEFITSL
jgi:hypothetical protein